MEGSVCEAFAVILSKELAVTQSDVVNLVTGAASVHPLPLLWRLLSFSVLSQGKIQPDMRRVIKCILNTHTVLTNTKQCQCHSQISPSALWTLHLAQSLWAKVDLLVTVYILCLSIQK